MGQTNFNSNENRRQKVFNKGALRLCRRGLTFQNLPRLHDWDCFIFRFGGLGVLFGGLSPQTVVLNHF